MAKITTDFMPPDGMMRVPLSACEDLFNKGYAYIRLPNGNMRKITSKDVLISADEVRELERKWRSGELPLPPGVTLPPENKK